MVIQLKMDWVKKPFNLDSVVRDLFEEEKLKLSSLLSGLLRLWENHGGRRNISALLKTIVRVTHSSMTL